MKDHHKGIHHITVNGGDPRQNTEFYVRTLGMRLVKRSVNQDATDTYHFFYSNMEGAPGTNLSFFPWANVPRGQAGVGQAVIVSLTVPPQSKDFWKEHLAEENIEFETPKRFGRQTIRFKDPDGLQLELVPDEQAAELSGWDSNDIPAEHSIRGFRGTTLRLKDHRGTERVLKELFGFQQKDKEGKKRLYTTDAPIGGSLIIEESDGKFTAGGRGTVHHVAFRAKDKEEQEEMREKVLDFGLSPSPIVDRHWFHSLYFQSPGGVLFEIATDGPGFTVDEEPEKLGEHLVLAPWLESRREEIENQLPEINV